MTAAPARVTRCPAVLIVRPMTVVRVARITTLRTVAHALVALLLVLVVAIAVAIALAALAADSRGPGERHITNASGARPRVPVEGPAGECDRRAGQDVALEGRGRHRRGRVDPPRHVARLGAA